LIPATSNQLLILVAVVLPGIVFGTVLQRLRGPTPEDRDVGTRVLRAAAVGVALDISYVLVGGFAITGLFLPASAGGADLPRLVTHPREAALWALLLVGVVPGSLALLVHARAVLRDAPEGSSLKWRLQQVARTTYRRTPTAWDYIARKRGGCFVRVRLTDGEYIGGWVKADSYVSGYPEPRDLFISSQWAVDPQGRFLHKIPGTLGFYLAVGEGVLVEWLEKPSFEPTVEPPSDQKKGRLS
jgi:hypothetical protein